MTLHLLKDPVSPLALQLLSFAPAPQSDPPVVVLLSSMGALPVLLTSATSSITENPLTQPSQQGEHLSYERLVALIFESEKVLVW